MLELDGKVVNTVVYVPINSAALKEHLAKLEKLKSLGLVLSYGSRPILGLYVCVVAVPNLNSRGPTCS